MLHAADPTRDVRASTHALLRIGDDISALLPQHGQPVSTSPNRHGALISGDLRKKLS